VKNLAQKIVKASKRYEVYAVGGFVRDMILGLDHTDIDLCVNKNAKAFSKKIASLLNGKLIVLDESANTYRIILKKHSVKNIDISLMDGADILEDLKNRDFTANSCAFDLAHFDDFKNHLIFAGTRCLKDIQSKTLNAGSPAALAKDPLRILRAFRFCAELDFVISKGLLKSISKHAKLLKTCAPERIKAELFRILACPKCAPTVLSMYETKTLEAVLPEISNMRKADKKYYFHAGGLMEHSLDAFCAVEYFLGNLKDYFPQVLDKLEKSLNDNKCFSEYVTRRGLLKFAGLFHDSGKPETASKIKGKVHFFGHEELGAEKAKKAMEAIRMSKRDIAFVYDLISDHMRLANLTKTGDVTERAILRYFRHAGSQAPDQIILSMSDWQSYKKLKHNPHAKVKRQMGVVEKMMTDYFIAKEYVPPKKLIDGHIIMKKFKLAPGPEIGKLLKIVADAQDEGLISTSKEALDLAASKLTRQ
jgi:putative nucleotidyltransferase with HDIG domain